MHPLCAPLIALMLMPAIVLGQKHVDFSHQGRENAGANAERTETWELDGDGMLHVTITNRATGSEPATTAATYRRN